MWCCFLISHPLPHLPQFIIFYSYVFHFIFYSLISRTRYTVPMKGNLSMVRNYNIFTAYATDPQTHSILSLFLLFLFLHTSFFVLSHSSYLFLCCISFHSLLTLYFFCYDVFIFVLLSVLYNFSFMMNITSIQIRL